MSIVARIPAAELPDDRQARAVDYVDGFGRPARALVVRWNGTLRAYRNLCPHWSSRLDSTDDGRFFDPSHSVLQCQTHGARFDPDTGECTMGPCIGQHLAPMDVEMADDGHTAILRRPGPSLSSPS